MHNEGRGVALVFRQRRRGDDGRTTFERRELLDLAQNEDKAHHPLVIQRRPMKKGHAQRFLFAVTLLLALSACTTTAVASADEEECGVWFAPSTIPGAGFGIFAGQNYDAGSIILSGELSVPIHDLAWNNGDGDGAEGKPPNLWDDYHWNADAYVEMVFESRTVYGASFGMGALPNCIFPLVNLDDRRPEDISFDRAGIMRDDPGAGAFTPYHNRAGAAEHDIAAGTELFLWYGENYFELWDKDPSKPIVPRLHEYRKGNQLMHGLSVVLRQTDEREEARTCTSDKIEETTTWAVAADIFALMNSFLHLIHRSVRSIMFWHEAKQEEATCTSDQDSEEKNAPEKETTTCAAEVDMFALTDAFLDLLHQINLDWRSGTLATLPFNYKQMVDLMEDGVENRESRRSRRSLEELRESGICIDHVRAGKSTLPHAGRGAFARRKIGVGDVVLPLPLIHIGNRSIYEIYAGTVHGRFYGPATERGPIHRQLLINYCLGHRESTLLLCPYSSGLVNHSQQRTNVKLRWSEKAGRKPEWFHQSLKEWSDDRHAGLTMELVATRDISDGEEIFMDYGDEWEHAWQYHLAHWEPPREVDWYRPSSELNEDPDLVVRTATEGSYDDSLFLSCREYYLVRQGLEPSDYQIHPCVVVDRRWTPDGYRYRAELVEDDEDEGRVVRGTCRRKVFEVLWDLPRDAFYFEDMMYSLDHLQAWSFRHDMRIPDDMFPEAWKNVRW